MRLTWANEEAKYCDGYADDKVENKQPAPRRESKSVVHVMVPGMALVRASR